MSELRKGQAALRVVAPCSTSNLGAGFDALGIALGGPALALRWSDAEHALRIDSLSGEGKDALPRDASNRVLVVARAHCERIGASFDSLRGSLEIDNTIPLARGLGSSAAAAVAGALLAEALCTNDTKSPPRSSGDERVLATALSMEGHPDNVIASLRGGAQVAVLDANGAVQACPIAPAKKLRAAIFIPDAELKTSEARAVIPRTVPLGDAVFNLGRAALFVAALSAGRFELIGEAMADRLHQPPRTQLMPWLPELIAAARGAGALGAALSGAGTTVFALAEPERAEAVAAAFADRAKALSVPGRAMAIDAFAPGARVEPG